MLSPKGVSSVVDRIMSTGGMTEDMQNDVRRLKDELDEREGILRRYGEDWDGESEEYDWRARPIEDYKDRFDELSGKYNELVDRYNRKFFAGGSAHETDTTLNEGDNKVPDSTGTDVRINDLFVDVK